MASALKTSKIAFGAAHAGGVSDVDASLSHAPDVFKSFGRSSGSITYASFDAVNNFGTLSR